MLSAFHEVKCIALTSPLPCDGKTTVATNLALSFSEIPNHRTLIIDMDLRKMSAHKYFDIDLNLIWESIRVDVPTLIEKIESYLSILV